MVFCVYCSQNESWRTRTHSIENGVPARTTYFEDPDGYCTALNTAHHVNRSESQQDWPCFRHPSSESVSHLLSELHRFNADLYPSQYPLPQPVSGHRHSMVTKAPQITSKMSCSPWC